MVIYSDMDNLSQSLKDEIESSPETYFLTYDMYDLLIDWCQPYSAYLFLNA